MLKIVLGVVLVAIIAVLGLAASKPNTFVVKRSIVIKAPPERLVAMVDDFHRWRAWSPWEKIDPNMSRAYEGPASGVGAAYGWSSSGKVGAGRMEVKSVTADREVLIQLDFLKPFKASNLARFTFAPEADGTRVTWSMEGKSPFISKLMGLVFNMDQAIGGDFEKGLGEMKAQVERPA